MNESHVHMQDKFDIVIKYASMAELADAPDLGSGGEIHAGSIPVTRTNTVIQNR